MYRRVQWGTALILGVTLYGTVGFHLISHVPWLLALYYVAVVISTVGDAGIHPKTPEATLFTLILVVVGTAAWIFWVSILVSLIVEVDLGYYQEQRWKRRVARMEGHF